VSAGPAVGPPRHVARLYSIEDGGSMQRGGAFALSLLHAGDADKQAHNEADVTSGT
jgi:hypothetical protein